MNCNQSLNYSKGSNSCSDFVERSTFLLLQPIVDSQYLGQLMLQSASYSMDGWMDDRLTYLMYN